MPYCHNSVGQSAGGNLAAAVALKLWDDKFQLSINIQVLICPVLQGIDFRHPSMTKFVADNLWIF